MEEKIVNNESQETTNTTFVKPNVNTNTDANDFDKLMTFVTLLLTFIGYGCLFLKYIFYYSLASTAGNVLRLIFFAFAFACIIAFFVITFFIRKKNKLDALTVLNIIAMFICFF